MADVKEEEKSADQLLQIKITSLILILQVLIHRREQHGNNAKYIS